jgi:hypothetical protein
VNAELSATFTHVADIAVGAMRRKTTNSQQHASLSASGFSAAKNWRRASDDVTL